MFLTNNYRRSIFHFVLVLFILFQCWFSKLYCSVRVVPPNKKMASAILVFVDSTTYGKVSEAVTLYRDAMERDELSAYILIANWKNPDQIRDQIKKMIGERLPIEGIVLVGDIPIPMILDAQHLTSAFKIDQDRYPRLRTAVPSDRFYDDLDLVFHFLGQDSTNTLLFYYSLSSDSPQKITSDIYSGRIKPGVDGEEKYRILDSYLRRISQQKQQKNQLNQGLVISGHGYHSESLTAWASEYLEWSEHLPVFFLPGGNLRMLYHQMDLDLKAMTLLQLQQPDLDLAIFHAHGDADVQYLAGLPEGKDILGNIEAVKYYLRSKLRQAKRQKKSIEQVIADFQSKLNVPESWFSDAFEESVIQKDSLLNYGLDIHIEDIRQISPQAEFIIFDQCFNGAFIHSPYIAGEYVFGKGTTIAAAANSVNIIQDLWANQNLGLLAYGMRVGKWNQERNYLETHIIGDPTFHFTPQNGEKVEPLWNYRIVPEKRWGQYVNHRSPAVRALALKKWFRQRGADIESDLVQIYHSDPAGIVRLQALECLAELRSPAFEDLLNVSVNDPFELIRRFTVKWMGDGGSATYLPALLNNLYLDPAKRVNSGVWDAISKIGSTTARRLAAELSIDQIDENIWQRINSQARSDSNWIYQELLPAISNDTLELRKRISAGRTFRNYRFQEIVPMLLHILGDQKKSERLRVTIAEALGWYTMSLHRSKILEACRNQLLLEAEDSPIFLELRKTIRRLETGPNNAFTP